MGNFIIKKKIVNHLTLNGKKKTGEKLLLKSIKKLQKESLKQTEELIKLALVHVSPLFKLQKFTSKRKKKKTKIKEVPFFILNNNSRISLAIKFIIRAVDARKSNEFCTQWCREVLANSKQSGDAVKMKNELQKQVLLQKRFFRFYKWA